MKKGGNNRLFSLPLCADYKASFNALPARNLGVLAALICNGSPVLGLRPARAARSPT